MIGHWKGPTAPLQVGEHTVATFLMQGFEPLLEHAFEIHVGLANVVFGKGSVGL
jgi:hypothetical protein